MVGDAGAVAVLGGVPDVDAVEVVGRAGREGGAVRGRGRELASAASFSATRRSMYVQALANEGSIQPACSACIRAGRTEALV